MLWAAGCRANLSGENELPAPALTPNPPIRHVTVYRQKGRFCGWPANNGAWIWGNEILVCFDLHHFKEPDFDIDPTDHHRDPDKPGQVLLARSTDGGQTWRLERPRVFSTDRTNLRARPCPGGINFTHPDFALRARWDRFHISYDRARTWEGPYNLGDFGPNMAARTDYIVNGPHDCMLFFGAAGRPICARTTDAGKTFRRLCDTMAPGSPARAIMPSTVRISKTGLLSALRKIKGEPYVSWIDVYSSGDDGRTWRFLSKVADADDRYWNGNPPSLLRLTDGRLCVTYGYRAVPYGIRAKLSRDNGRTWGPEIILREDGRNWDLGYTRTVQRTDGKLVTMYYFSTEDKPQQRIEATIWDPDTVTARSADLKALDDIAEHIAGIEEAMKQIDTLSAGPVQSVNPLVAQFKIKEKHCDSIREIVSYHFMSQRLTPPAKSDKAAYQKYLDQLALLQELLHYNMQAKKTNDLSHVEKMRDLLRRFRQLYFPKRI
ncbi:MAG: sialidase family protein [Planctomycetota bacterium]